MAINIFQTPRLTFRAVDTSKDIDLFRAINDDRIGYSTSNRSNAHLPSPADAEEWMWGKSSSLLSAIICLRPDSTLPQAQPQPSDMPIGQIELRRAAPNESHHRNTELSINVLSKYQGNGYGSEAIAWALDYAFRSIGLHRVVVRALGYNEAVIRLYKRLGFQVEGILREEIRWEGRWWDGVVLGILDREWPVMREALGVSGVLLRDYHS